MRKLPVAIWKWGGGGVIEEIELESRPGLWQLGPER